MGARPPEERNSGCEVCIGELESIEHPHLTNVFLHEVPDGDLKRVVIEIVQAGLLPAQVSCSSGLADVQAGAPPASVGCSSHSSSGRPRLCERLHE
jgi:hypothetical protein